MKGRIRAAFYDCMTRGWERKHGRELRAPLLAHARGRVLEIGGGTGANLPHYPNAVEQLVVTEPTEGMLARMRDRLGTARADVTAAQAPAEALPFDDGSFDTVVSTLVLCTVPDQDAALSEVKRVLRPGGQFIFIEHVRSDDPRRAKWQNRLEGVWKVVADGCNPNRDTLSRIQANGFVVEDLTHGELPASPRIVRPYITGRAIIAGRPSPAGDT